MPKLILHRPPAANDRRLRFLVEVGGLPTEVLRASATLEISMAVGLHTVCVDYFTALAARSAAVRRRRSAADRAT